MSKSKSLGRGLGELLGEMEEAYDNEIPKNETIVEIPLSQISPNPHQPRKTFDQTSLNELAESIKMYGLIQPVVVVEKIDGYVLVAGERRWRASRLAKLDTIRAIVATLSGEKMREQALIENIQRDDLNIVDLAAAYDELIKVHDITHDALSTIVHKSRVHITNTIRLLQLSARTRKALMEGKITAGHAKVLIGLSEKEQQLIVDSIIGQKLSVREIEFMVKGMKNRHKSPVKPLETASYDFSKITSRLNKFGFKNSIKSNKLTIEFTDESDLSAFLTYFQ